MSKRNVTLSAFENLERLDKKYSGNHESSKVFIDFVMLIYWIMKSMNCIQ